MTQIYDITSKQFLKVFILLNVNNKSSRKNGYIGNKPPTIINEGDRNPGNVNFPRIVLGLDIGFSKIVAIIGRLNQKGLLEILGFGEALSDGLIRGSIFKVSKTSAGVKCAMKLAWPNLDTDDLDIKV